VSIHRMLEAGVGGSILWLAIAPPRWAKPWRLILILGTACSCVDPFHRGPGRRAGRLGFHPSSH
jgi:hypothetical protein